MEKKNNKSFISSTAEIFSLSLIFVTIFNLVLSEDSDELRGVSELFALCGEGISFKAIGQLLLLSLIIAGLRGFFFFFFVFKNMLMINRITLMLVSVFFASAVCSVIFGWFPLSMWQAWLGFVLSFAVGTAVSFAVMFIRTRAESRKFQNNLAEYNKLHETGDK